MMWGIPAPNLNETLQGVTHFGFGFDFVCSFIMQKEFLRKFDWQIVWFWMAGGGKKNLHLEIPNHQGANAWAMCLLRTMPQNSTIIKALKWKIEAIFKGDKYIFIIAIQCSSIFLQPGDLLFVIFWSLHKIWQGNSTIALHIMHPGQRWCIMWESISSKTYLLYFNVHALFCIFDIGTVSILLNQIILVKTFCFQRENLAFYRVHSGVWRGEYNGLQNFEVWYLQNGNGLWSIGAHLLHDFFRGGSEDQQMARKWTNARENC